MTTRPLPHLTIHYFAWDHRFEELGLWTWDGHGRHTPGQQELAPRGQDSFGAVFRLDPADFTGPGMEPRIGFLFRRQMSWDRKDGGDRFWDPDLGEEIWIVEGDPTIHRTMPEVRPKIRFSFQDAADRLTVFLSVPLAELLPAFTPSSAAAFQEGAEPIRATRYEPMGLFGLRLWLAAGVPVDGTRWELRIPGVDSAPLIPRWVLRDGSRFGSTKAMGATVAENWAEFRVFSPAASSVEVLLLPTRDAKEPEAILPLHRGEGGVWERLEEGALSGKYYWLRIRHPFEEEPTILSDIHATNPTGLDRPTRLTLLSETDPPGFRPVQRPPFSGRMTDAVIHELSVRDFSSQAGGGMTHRGKFLSFTELGAHVEGHPALTSGVEHLRELGITHVQLLPIQDFDNHEESPEYNWGYMTLHFNGPDGSFAQGLADDSRIRNCKEMVAALHAAGIRVVLDVVYNHTAHGASFHRTAPGYYHRMREDGSFWDGSGTGNELASEAPMVRKFILDSLKFWVTEYGVDGFRFDLLGLLDRHTLHLVKEELLALEPTLLLYGEPWAAGPTGLGHATDKWALRGSGIGSFNDHYRDALKGSPDGAALGYVQGGALRAEVVHGIAGSIEDWAVSPMDCVNYADCHDNLTLWDKLAASCPAESEGERVKMHNLVLGILAVSQGGLFIHGGHEFARTKGGHHNSYNAPDAVNQLDWTRKHRYRSVFEFTKGMIALRKAHPLFRLGSAEEVRERLHFEAPVAQGPQKIQFAINGKGLRGESWNEARVLINPYRNARTFHLPEGEWNVHVRGAKAELKAFGQERETMSVPGRSMVVLAR